MKMEMESKDFVGIKEMLTVRQYRSIYLNDINGDFVSKASN